MVLVVKRESIYQEANRDSIELEVKTATLSSSYLSTMGYSEIYHSMIDPDYQGEMDYYPKMEERKSKPGI